MRNPWFIKVSQVYLEPINHEKIDKSSDADASLRQSLYAQRWRSPAELIGGDTTDPLDIGLADTQRVRERGGLTA